MKRPGWVACALIAALAVPAMAQARSLSVEVWTDRGDEAVYDKGDLLKLGVRATDDSHLLVYEIDAEGYVNLLFPYETSDFIEARQTYRIPDRNSDMELVVDGPTGEGYIVAIASREPFGALPWYLRPYNPQAAALGYEGDPEEEQGVTAEGRIVGDPFVAMERIRRRVLTSPDDEESFATAYTSYYLHEVVKYPRYLCYDCHRPGYWSWWDGFDPYYTTCSAFSFRVNYSWYWGPSYWFGSVPYFVYNCRPGYGWRGRTWYSSWDGWGYWSSIWGGPLRRYKGPAPAGYIPPERFKHGTPPGLVAAHDRRKGGAMILPRGHNERAGGDDGRNGTGTRVERGERGAVRQPAGQVRGDEGSKRPADERGGIQRRPATQRGGDDGSRGPAARPAPRPEPARKPADRPSAAPERKPRGQDTPRPAPTPEPAREPKKDDPAPPPAPAHKPRDGARPVPAKGRDGGRDGNRIGFVERGGARIVQSGEAGHGIQWRRIAPAPRGTVRQAPRSVQRSTPIWRGTREVQRPAARASRSRVIQRSAPAPRPAKAVQRKASRPAREAPARAAKSDRNASKGGRRGR